MEPESGLALALENELGLQTRAGANWEEIRSALSSHINELINRDFNQLVSLLYRVDVSEKKLRDMLAGQGGEDSAQLIADLILERQVQKLRSRREHRSDDKDNSGEERW